MSHHIYTTPGFVIASYPHGEAGKSLYIFTRDLGMVYATAQGVRKDNSKLRYHIQDFALSTFSLVRGKEVWRLVGAEKIAGVKAMHKPAKELYVRILKMLKRLVTGEEKHNDLFDVVYSAWQFLETTEDAQAISASEYIIMLRLLHLLGYVRNAEPFTDFFIDNTFSPELLAKITTLRSRAAQEINQALKESQL